ncbi:MAG TPA: plastocyanin/azurin family copper-binding protein [Baekduia sp.]
MTVRLLVLTCCSSAALAAGCGGGGGGEAQTLAAGDTIGMKSLRFHPDHAQVAVGQKVTWKNYEGVPHDVKADSGASFASKTFGKDGTFSFTPTKAGTIKYECTLHPGMDGTLDVVAR